MNTKEMPWSDYLEFVSPNEIKLKDHRIVPNLENLLHRGSERTGETNEGR